MVTALVFDVQTYLFSVRKAQRENEKSAFYVMFTGLFTSLFTITSQKLTQIFH